MSYLPSLEVLVHELAELEREIGDSDDWTQMKKHTTPLLTILVRTIQDMERTGEFFTAADLPVLENYFRLLSLIAEGNDDMEATVREIEQTVRELIAGE